MKFHLFDKMCYDNSDWDLNYTINFSVSALLMQSGVLY